MTQSSQRGFALWFTGLPCSGKSTLSEKIEAELRKFVPFVEHLDGDVIRRGLSKDLGFSKEDRDA
ncbi:MAG TPA: adenylyl-sulfate kinase, partial [Candidatus Omnitrophota bacterium]|nr:adenylyl-sulfate kinase [Candidatus Omnitrophota bacterium]